MGHHSTDGTAEPLVMRTERLILRACAASDGALLAELYADPEVSRFIGGDLLDEEKSRAQAQRFASVWDSSGYGQSILLDTTTREVVGRVGLHPWPEWDELELGWVLARRRQGQGLAQEAARAWLDWAGRAQAAPYLTAVIHPDNVASIRLAERLGFTFDRPDTTPWNDVVIYRYDFT